MKTYTYTFQRNGYYLSSGSNKAEFGSDDRALLLVEPTDYTLEVSGQVLCKANCPGFKIQVTNKGGADIRDWQENLLASLPEMQKTYAGFQLEWAENTLRICFGHTEEVDNYPNCDGESDRWSTTWVIEHTVAYP